MIPESITIAKALVGLAKETKSLIPRGNTELSKRMQEVLEKSLEMQISINELTEENRQLKQKLQLHEKMEFKEPYYYQAGDAVPFCPVCFEEKGKVLHLHKFSDGAGKGHNCKVCNSRWVDEKRKSSPVLTVGRA